MRRSFIPGRPISSPRTPQDQPPQPNARCCFLGILPGRLGQVRFSPRSGLGSWPWPRAYWHHLAPGPHQHSPPVGYCTFKLRNPPSARAHAHTRAFFFSSLLLCILLCLYAVQLIRPRSAPKVKHRRAKPSSDLHHRQYYPHIYTILCQITIPIDIRRRPTRPRVDSRDPVDGNRRGPPDSVKNERRPGDRHTDWREGKRQRGKARDIDDTKVSPPVDHRSVTTLCALLPRASVRVGQDQRTLVVLACLAPVSNSRPPSKSRQTLYNGFNSIREFRRMHSFHPARLLQPPKHTDSAIELLPRFHPARLQFAIGRPQPKRTMGHSRQLPVGGHQP